MHELEGYIRLISSIIEVVGVAIMVVGLLYAMFIFLAKLKDPKSYTTLRQQVGKAILLGLEVLVAADIIATVTTEPTVESLLALGLIVIIRTFLSFSLEVELEGKWPWQQHHNHDVPESAISHARPGGGMVDRE